MYLPGETCAIVGTAVCPAGQSVSLEGGGGFGPPSKWMCQICLPVATSIPNRSSLTPATTPISRDALRRRRRFSAMSGENRLCIARGVLSSLSFHSSFVLPTLAGVKIFSSLTQPVRPLSTP